MQELQTSVPNRVDGSVVLSCPDNGARQRDRPSIKGTMTLQDPSDEVSGTQTRRIMAYDGFG